MILTKTFVLPDQKMPDCLWNSKPLPQYDKILAICSEKNLRGIAIYGNPYLVSYTVFMNAILHPRVYFHANQYFRKL